MATTNEEVGELLECWEEVKEYLKLDDSTLKKDIADLVELWDNSNSVIDDDLDNMRYRLMALIVGYIIGRGGSELITENYELQGSLSILIDDFIIYIRDDVKCLKKFGNLESVILTNKG